MQAELIARWQQHQPENQRLGVQQSGGEHQSRADPLPGGFGASGLPLGLQLVGRSYADATLLRIGQAYEQATGWMERWPT